MHVVVNMLLMIQHIRQIGRPVDCVECNDDHVIIDGGNGVIHIDVCVDVCVRMKCYESAGLSRKNVRHQVGFIS